MPTKKFLDLSEEKKKAFLDAAIQEFERQSYEEASIFNIARNAGVSRTGVYYYFSNKQDIYDYLLLQIRDGFLQRIKSLGKMTIFKLFLEYLEYMAEFKGKKEEKFIRQTFTNAKDLRINSLSIAIQKLSIEFNNSEDLIDLSELKYLDKDILGIMSLMVVTCISKGLDDYFLNRISLDEARSRCELFIDCIKTGFVK